MENQLRYQVRSREIIDLVSAMRTDRLVLSAYFQRNLVWRDMHKREFIDTILKGYPFPQIFLARGPIDVETMEASTCVVDGQQRLNAIREYVADKFPVNGKLFSALSVREREEFLKYEVPVIDFDLDAGDERLKEVFKRLNRTFYSLSTIERMATEYSASQFLLVARVLCGDIAKKPSQLELEVEGDAGDDADEHADADGAVSSGNDFLRDPGVDDETWDWLLENSEGAYAEVISSDNVFSHYEAQRKVPLMFVLNVMCSIESGYYNRNARVKEYLERYNDDFPQADKVIKRLNAVGDFVSKMNLPNNSIWWNKANFFTLSVELERVLEDLKAPAKLGKALTEFEQNLPKDFALAAREAVNNKNERALRARYFREVAGIE